MVNVWWLTLSSQRRGRCKMISSGSVSAARMTRSAIPLLRALVVSLAPFFNYIIWQIGKQLQSKGDAKPNAINSIIRKVVLNSWLIIWCQRRRILLRNHLHCHQWRHSDSGQNYHTCLYYCAELRSARISLESLLLALGHTRDFSTCSTIWCLISDLFN